MEQEIQEPETADKQGKQTNVGVAYPVATVKESLAVIDGLVDTFGTGSVITKDDISKATGKKVNTLILSFSTYQQYGILEKVHGKGFKTSELYKKYRDKIFPHHELEAQREMFAKAPLYQKIVDNLNNTYLPTEEKFKLILQGDLYKVVPSSTDKAAKVFFTNLRDLNLLVNNSLRYSTAIQPATPPPGQGEIPPPVKKLEDPEKEELFTMPIPLPGSKRKAYLQYPLESLTARDIRVIEKAVAFIKSSIVDDENEKE